MANDMEYTVRRGGTVVRKSDTVEIGRVTREPSRFAYITGEFRATTTAGADLGLHRTQRDAARRVSVDTQPLAVSDVRLRRVGVLCGVTIVDLPVLLGRVSYRGEVWHVSRRTDEAVWVADSYSTARSGMPVFSNGTATRVTRAHVMADNVAALLDAEVARQGLSPAGYDETNVHTLPTEWA